MRCKHDYWYHNSILIMKVKFRKLVPSPAKWYMIDTDNCYGCKNRNNCNHCKLLLQHNAIMNKKRDRKEKQKIKQLY